MPRGMLNSKRGAGVRKGRRGRPPGSRNRVVSASSGSARVIAEMNAYHAELASRCAAIQTEMDALASAIRTMQGGAPTAARKSAGRRSGAVRGPRGEGASLKDYIARVLGSAGSAMRLTDVANAVVSAGYPTKSRNLPNQVSMAMAAMVKKRLIRKVGRGLYRV